MGVVVIVIGMRIVLGWIRMDLLRTAYVWWIS